MGLFGNLFGGLAQAAGDVAEGLAYGQAEKYANQNATISQEAGDIKLEQTNRQVYRVLGQQQAGYAGAGLTTGGSAQSVLRSSVSQGSLERAIVGEQTAINVIGYKEQASQFAGLKAAAFAGAASSALKGLPF